MRRFIAAMAFAAVVGLPASQVVTVEPAQAVTAAQCIDAHSNPQGSVATQCHQAGWTVNGYVVVDPGLWVRWTDMRQCRDEFGTSLNPCYWNFWSPPSYGDKYWFDIGGHRHGVYGVHWGA